MDIKKLQWNIKLYRNALQLSIRLGTLNISFAHNAVNNLEMKVIYLSIILLFKSGNIIFLTDVIIFFFQKHTKQQNQF